MSEKVCTVNMRVWVVWTTRRAGEISYLGIDKHRRREPIKPEAWTLSLNMFISDSEFQQLGVGMELHAFAKALYPVGITNINDSAFVTPAGASKGGAKNRSPHFAMASTSTVSLSSLIPLFVFACAVGRRSQTR